MSETMNGNETIPPLQIANPVVQMLEEMLAQARQGAVTSAAVLMVSNVGQVMTAYTGVQRSDLHLGCNILQGRIIHDVMTPPAQQQPRILRPMR